MARIFWVEDQSHWIERFQRVLEHAELDDTPNEVITCKFTNAARQQIALMQEHQKPDIALLDAHMGGNSGAGFSVSRALKAKWPELPIIYLSEHSGTAIEQQALEDHAQDFIAKHQRNIEEVLCWRIKARLKQKSSKENVDEVVSGHLKIDLTNWEIFWKHKKLMNPTNAKRPLPPMPRKILYQQVQHTPRPVTTLQMAEALDLDPEKFSYANYRQHIKTLRHSFDQAEEVPGTFIAESKNGRGIVTFGDDGAYCWKQ